MTTTAKKALTPREARTDAAILKLPRDNWEYRGHWMLLNETYVTIAKQKRGEKADYMVRISRSVFEAFIRAYDTGSTRK